MLCFSNVEYVKKSILKSNLSGDDLASTGDDLGCVACRVDHSLINHNFLIANNTNYRPAAVAV
jgi:hypothetical protein